MEKLYGKVILISNNKDMFIIVFLIIIEKNSYRAIISKNEFPFNEIIMQIRSCYACIIKVFAMHDIRF